jgi:sucrose-6-phosphate hydrolase SacC (GH32 family)
MKWESKGIIFEPSVFKWSEHTCLQPTPLSLGDRIRVFVGSRDKDGISRIGYVDLCKNDLTQVIGFSEKPILDVGSDGCFDESGVVPSAVVEKDGLVYLFYAGYQLGHKVRFSVLGGVAVSRDGGCTFKRLQNTPVFERNDKETIFRVPHSVVFENGKWKAWYGGGSKFIQGENKTLPVYDIRYTESDDISSFKEQGKVILTTKDDEYRLGRPYLFIKSKSEYYLFYGFSTESTPYNLGYAFSSDLNNWKRLDDTFKLERSDSGWDSEMVAYPSVLEVNNKVFMFYNGNDYGKSGFGLAELIEW